MKIRPTLEEAKQIMEKGNYGVIPISTEIYSDSTTPIEVLRRLKVVSRHVYLLESAEVDKKWGRYSFLGYDPVMSVSCYNGQVTIKTSMLTQNIQDNPRQYIREIVEENRSPQLEYLPSFTGGLVGYFSYDYIKYSEPALKLDAADEEGFQDVDLMLFDKVIAFDNYRQKIVLIANMKTEDLETAYHKAVMELENMKALVEREEKQPISPLRLLSDFEPLFDETQYCD
ncbi:MAG: anthranilate synthase component I, partial [Acetatifactor sp.]|nr:anthranilate synthase component I [Acetatifactor sp.]